MLVGKGRYMNKVLLRQLNERLSTSRVEVELLRASALPPLHAHFIHSTWQPSRARQGRASHW
eukprot:scaffold1561_cov129-Skeletonema_menzelii.AAC.4